MLLFDIVTLVVLFGALPVLALLRVVLSLHRERRWDDPFVDTPLADSPPPSDAAELRFRERRQAMLRWNVYGAAQVLENWERGPVVFIPLDDMRALLEATPTTTDDGRLPGYEQLVADVAEAKGYTNEGGIIA